MARPFGTADRSRIVVYIETAKDAGGYYLFDVAKSQLALIGMLHPEFKGSTALGDRQAITYPARDGTRVPAVLTLPANKPRDTSPSWFYHTVMLVLVLILSIHGSPVSLLHRDTLWLNRMNEALLATGMPGKLTVMISGRIR